MLPPDPLDDPAPAIARFGRTMLARGMTDVAGGNISVRRGDAVYMTPRYAGHRHHWQLEASQILAFDVAGKPLDDDGGDGEPSRDLAVHLAVYAAAPESGAVVHAHAPHCLAFATAGVPIPPAIAAAALIGPVPVVPGDDEAAEVGAFAARPETRARIEAFAAAVLIARHGVVVIGRDLAHAYDGLERVEACARSIVLARAIRFDPAAPHPEDISPATAPRPVNGRAAAAV